jgi:hypothetical protein
MNDLIAISAVIGDRSYRIKIEPADEQGVRKTLKAINDKVIEFKTEFAGKDMQDYVAMVLVWFATEQNASVASGIAKENFAEKLDDIEKLLDSKL